MSSHYDLKPTIDRISAVSFDRNGETASGQRGATASPESLRSALLSIEGVAEALVVRTCERYELYVSADHPMAAIERVIDHYFESDPTRFTGTSAVEHLFRVACGLESGVLGEDEILGQLKASYRAASEEGALGNALDTTVLKAIRVGERARSETSINEGRLSLGSITVDRLTESVDSMTTAAVLVIGAGEVAGLVLDALEHRSHSPATIMVANRSLDAARQLADSVGGTAGTIPQARDRIDEFDAIITATAATEPILEPADVGEGSSVLIDLANPPDIDPSIGDATGTTLYSLDDLLDARIEGTETRRSAIPDVEAIIDEALHELEWQLRAERVDDLLGEIYGRAHRTRGSEFEAAVSRLESKGDPLSPLQKRVLRDFSESLVNKLLHPKTNALKQAAASGDRATVDAWFQLLESRNDGPQRPAKGEPSAEGQSGPTECGDAPTGPQSDGS